MAWRKLFRTKSVFLISFKIEFTMRLKVIPSSHRNPSPYAVCVAIKLNTQKLSCRKSFLIIVSAASHKTPVYINFTAIRTYSGKVPKREQWNSRAIKSLNSVRLSRIHPPSRSARIIIMIHFFIGLPTQSSIRHVGANLLRINLLIQLRWGESKSLRCFERRKFNLPALKLASLLTSSP